MNSGSKNLVVFDMDGVIMDVSASYRESTRRTARQFFQGAAAFEDLPDPLFSLKDLAAVKQSGGLNNDWETTYLVISLLLTRVDVPDTPRDDDEWRLRQKVMAHCDLSDLIAFLESDPYPLKVLLHENDRVESDLVKRLSSGDVGNGNIIKQIFQEIYLGEKLFEAIYRIPARTNPGDGLIHQEKLLIAPRCLEMLSGRHILAIATGRPRAEADYPLKRFELHDFFHMILTLDDCIAEEKKRATQTGKRISLSKPHPFMLDVIAQSFAGRAKKNYYIGDMPDDMLAAQNAEAEFVGVGFMSPSPDMLRLKSRLIQAGADYVIEEIRELEEILSSGKHP